MHAHTKLPQHLSRVKQPNTNKLQNTNLHTLWIKLYLQPDDSFNLILDSLIINCIIEGLWFSIGFIWGQLKTVDYNSGAQLKRAFLLTHCSSRSPIPGDQMCSILFPFCPCITTTNTGMKHMSPIEGLGKPHH